MFRRDTERGFNRRDFMSSALALGGAAVAASVVGPSNAWGAVSHKPLDPVNPDILFGSTSSLWSGARSIEWAIKRISTLGLQGIEPYAAQIEKYRSNPLALKKLFDDAGPHDDRRVERREGTVHELHRSGSDPQNDCGPCGVRARFSPAVRLHSLEVQYGRSPGRAAHATISSRDSPTHSTRSAVRPSQWGYGWLRIRISGGRWSAKATCAASWN